MKKKFTIEVDEEAYHAASEMFKALGLDIDVAVNIFLNKSLMEYGLPFFVNMPFMGHMDDMEEYDDFEFLDDIHHKNNKRKKS